MICTDPFKRDFSPNLQYIQNTSSRRGVVLYTQNSIELAINKQCWHYTLDQIENLRHIVNIYKISS